MRKISTVQIITIIVTIVTIIVNGLANILPFNGQTTGEISDRFSIYFVPSGYVFSIWGLIYLGLLFFSLFQALPANRDNQLFKKIAPPYWISNLANATWVILWHYEYFPLTLFAMLVIFASLLYIYRQISQEENKSDNQTWFVRLPFSVYLAWISVALIANVSQVLFYSKWNGWGIPPAAWAVIMLVIATVIGMLMAWRERDNAFVLVLIWAFVGIALKQANSVLVANTAWVAVTLLGLSAIALPLMNRAMKRRT
jgi:hypothetical protein